MSKSEQFVIKVTSAFTRDGSIVTPGTVLEVDEKTTKNLVRRGKAELASKKAPTEAEGPIGTDGNGGAKRQGRQPADEKGNK